MTGAGEFEGGRGLISPTEAFGKCRHGARYQPYSPRTPDTSGKPTCNSAATGCQWSRIDIFIIESNAIYWLNYSIVLLLSFCALKLRSINRLYPL